MQNAFNLSVPLLVEGPRVIIGMKRNSALLKAAAGIRDMSLNNFALGRVTFSLHQQSK
jgi:hypothetical protein